MLKTFGPALLAPLLPADVPRAVAQERQIHCITVTPDPPPSCPGTTHSPASVAQEAAATTVHGKAGGEGEGGDRGYLT